LFSTPNTTPATNTHLKKTANSYTGSNYRQHSKKALMKWFVVPE
jgi:hypothetical protein